MADNFYIYVLLDTRKPGAYTYDDKYSLAYEPFYVGKGSSDRTTTTHRYSHHNNGLKASIIKKLGGNPIVVKLEENIQEAAAFDIERKLIKLIGRRDLKLGPLANMIASGGENNPWYENPTYGFKDKKHSDYSKSLISSKLKGKDLWKTRRVISQRVSVEGKIYKSIRDAAKNLNLHKDVVDRRCKSDKYPDFNYWI